MTARTKKVHERLRRSARMDSGRVHITARAKGWAVRKEGNLQASAVKTTQKAAIELARSLVRSGRATSIILHRKDGKFSRVS